MHTQSRTLFNIYRLGGHYTFMNTYSNVSAVTTSIPSTMPLPISWHTKPAPVIAPVFSLPVPQLSAPLFSPSFAEWKRDVTRHSPPPIVLPRASIATAPVFSIAFVSSSVYLRTSFQDWLQIVSRRTSPALSSVRPANRKTANSTYSRAASLKTASSISPQGQRSIQYKGKMRTRYGESRSSRSATRFVKGVCRILDP